MSGTRRVEPLALRLPQYGDEIVVPSQHPDGHWVNGIVNSGIRGQWPADGSMLVAAPGHRYSNLISIPRAGYGEHWMWPKDKGMKPSGAKFARLDDLDGR